MVTKMRAAALAWAGVAAATTIVLPVGVSTAAESGTTVVRGADFPVGTGLAHVSCDAPLTAGPGAATPYVGEGPGMPPLGERSLGFDLTGGGGAGPVAYTGSLAADGDASIAVNAEQGTTGVAWIGYRDPTEGDGLVWFGRAPITVPAGGWTSVDTAGLTLTWAHYDTTTGAQLATGPTATLTGLIAERGDGAGLVAITLGCDGAPFSVDAWRVGTQTYDLEGLETSLSMGGGGFSTLVAGDSLDLRGSLSTTGDVEIPRATVILERRTISGGWTTVKVVGAGDDLDAVVHPPVRTTYRWRFVDRPLASGSTSSTYVVDVARSVSAEIAGDTVVGEALPGRAGLQITLRHADTGEAVAATTSRAGGAYTLSTDGLSGGRYVVSVAAGDGNLRGDSDPVTIDGPPAPVDEAPEPPADDPSDGPTDAPPSDRPTQQPSTEPSDAPSAPASSPPTPSAPPSPEAPASPSSEPSREPSREPSAPADPPSTAAGSAAATPGESTPTP